MENALFFKPCRRAVVFVLLVMLCTLVGRQGVFAQATPSITTQPQSQSVVLGSNATFSLTVTGQSPLTYRWYFNSNQLLDGGRISGAGTTSLGISGVVSNDAGNYWGTVSNRHGVVTSEVAGLTVLLPPSITASPTSQTSIVGTVATFSVAAAGTAPLSYRWQKDAADLTDNLRVSGTTNALLTISLVQTNDAGSYRVWVSNAYGAVTSGVAAVTVVSPPAITQHPQAQDAVAGLPATFQVVATGTPPLTFQWKKDGTNVPSGTGATLILPSLQTNDAGIYSVVVSNAYGATPSSNAALNVLLPTCVEAPEGIVSWWQGGTTTDSVDGNYVGSPTRVHAGPGMVGEADDFQGSDLISLADADNLKFNNSFSIEAWINLHAYPPGNAGAPGAVILIRSDDRACFDPYYLAVTPGGALQFHVEDAVQTLPCGQSLTTAPLAVGRWYHVGAVFDAISGEMRLFTNGTLAAQMVTSIRPFRDLSAGLHPGVGIGNYANYSGSAPFNGFIDELAVYNRALSESEMSAIYHASFAGKCVVRPEIRLQPQSASVLAGGANVFQVVAAGKLPLTFQWQKDGVNLTNDGRVSGADTAVLAIAPLQTNDSGSYRVIVTNRFGSATSAAATLSVLTNPRITMQPMDQRVWLTQTARFTAAGAGTDPLTYRWFFGAVPLSDNVRINGATTTNLVIQNVQAEDVGSYSLTVSNSNGTASSATANLTLATVRYVNAANPAPAAPYISWATAARVIQDAIDISGPNDEIIVTNGTYATGGRAVFSNLVNRVAIDRPIAIRSLNGPAVTTIQGVYSPSSSAAVRCAWLTNGATLSGFTLKNGGVRNTGDWFQMQSGGGAMCSSQSAVISNCVFSTCRAVKEGGGCYSGTLYNCTLSGCSALEGGGTAAANLNYCTLSGNSATWGGGAYLGTLNNCVLSGNSAADPAGARTGNGGGASSASLTNCSLLGNSARVDGGGLSYGTLVNCLIAGNSALQGGGASAQLLINCTVVGNLANSDSQVGGGVGGGILGATVINSIALSNSATFGGHNYSSSSLSYSCAAPLADGDGNISSDPLFVNYAGGNYRLQMNSPCVNAGTNSPVSVSADLDGRARIGEGVVDLGAYEYQQPPFILAPLQFGGVSSNGFSFQFQSIAGVNYITEFKPDFAAPAWTELERRFGSGGLEVVTDPTAGQTMRLYRVRALFAPAPNLGAATPRAMH